MTRTLRMKKNLEALRGSLVINRPFAMTLNGGAKTKLGLKRGRDEVSKVPSHIFLRFYVSYRAWPSPCCPAEVHRPRPGHSRSFVRLVQCRRHQQIGASGRLELPGDWCSRRPCISNGPQ